MGNDAVCKSLGIGSVRIHMLNRVIRTLTNVRFVSDLRKSLISLGQLTSLGCRITADNVGLKVFREARVLMKGQLVQKLYLFKGSTLKGESIVGYSKKDFHRKYSLHQILEFATVPASQLTTVKNRL